MDTDFIELPRWETQTSGTMAQYPSQPQYPDTVLTSPCSILIMLYGVTSTNLISHCFDSAGIRTTDLLYRKPALYKFVQRYWSTLLTGKGNKCSAQFKRVSQCKVSQNLPRLKLWLLLCVRVCVAFVVALPW